MNLRTRYVDMLLFWRMQFIRIGRRGLCLYWCWRRECRAWGLERLVPGELWFLFLGPLTVSNHPIY